MAEENQKQVHEEIIDLHRSLVKQSHPKLLTVWPILSGFNVMVGRYGGWHIVIFTHTGNPVERRYSNMRQMPQAILGVNEINQSNKGAVRKRLERHFKLTPEDGIIFVDPAGNVSNELSIMIQKHEAAMGISPMRIFLSHKGADKPLVRDFKQTLELLGFGPWLDEDAMTAGTELERGLLRGFSESCAAIFFVTPNFADENYLASEVDYAIQEKRKKGDKFAIITLVFVKDGTKGTVPELLRRYVWKEPGSQLEALREIIKALPVQVGDVHWRLAH